MPAPFLPGPDFTSRERRHVVVPKPAEADAATAPRGPLVEACSRPTTHRLQARSPGMILTLDSCFRLETTSDGLGAIQHTGILLVQVACPRGSVVGFQVTSIVSCSYQCMVCLYAEPLLGRPR